jgi:arylsulfatase
LLPQLLRQFGYRSYHSGKWHLDGRPLQNGFDRSYSLNDHDRHFAPKQHQRDDVPLPPVQASEGYYSTIAIAQHTIDFLSEHAAEHADQPFFSFVAFTAPHFPVQAPQVDIQRYQERYRAGWDALREQRWQRLQSSGLVVGGLSSIERDLGPPYAFPEAIKKLGPDEVDRPLAWATLGQSQQAFQAQKMAVHAAMVDRMDREIGRILEQVRKMNAWDHTLVLFLSDNGASAEIMVRGDGHDRQAACGTGATFLSIGPGWSSLANTPFRRHKTWVHEGGIASPLIVHWPQGIRSPGSICALPSHAIDVVQTLLELAGETDVQAAGSTVKRPGISLVPSFRGVTQKREQALWWLHEGNRALRVGNWKIVASANQSWELYDLGVDRAEEHDLAAEDPQRLTALTTEWERIWKEVAEDARSGVASEPAVPSKPVKEAGDAHTPEHR